MKKGRIHMKKAVALTVTVLTALVFAFGCAENTPTNPAAAPTATPVILGGIFTLSDFDGNTTAVLVGSTTGHWFSGTDAAEGGTSVVNSFGPSLYPTPQTVFHSLAISATINSTLTRTYGDGELTAMAPVADKVGYVSASLVFADAVSLTSNASGGLIWYQTASNSSGLLYRLYLYDTFGRYAYTGTYGSSITWQYGNPCFADFNVPSGANYTVNDVLSSLKKMTWYFRIFTYGNGTLSTTISLDSLRTYDLCI